MAQITIDIVWAVLKIVKNACIEQKQCKGCQYFENLGSWSHCRLSGTPNNWALYGNKEELDGEGKSLDYGSGKEENR